MNLKSQKVLVIAVLLVVTAVLSLVLVWSKSAQQKPRVEIQKSKARLLNKSSMDNKKNLVEKAKVVAPLSVPGIPDTTRARPHPLP